MSSSHSFLRGKTDRTLALIGVIALACFGLGLAVDAAWSNPAAPTAAHQVAGFTDSQGRPIHPLVLLPFMPSFIVPNDDDGAPPAFALNADTTDPTVTAKVVEVSKEDGETWLVVKGPVSGLGRLQLEEAESTFGYRCLGKTDSGVYAVMTRDTCQYTSPGHVWLLLLRVESVRHPALNPVRQTTQVRLVGYRSPA